MKNKVFSQWHRRLLNVNSEYIQLLCKNLLLHHHDKEVMITITMMRTIMRMVMMMTMTMMAILCISTAADPWLPQLLLQ